MYKIYTEKPGMLKSHAPKLWLIMRLTIIILIAAFMQVSAAGFAQKISMSQSNAPLKKVLKELKSQSGYNFVYTDDLLRMAKPVDIKVNGAEFEDVLIQIFKEQPLTYIVNKNTITVKEKEKIFKANLIELEDIVVKGKISDAKGTTLPGVSVKVKGTTLGTSTDVNGNYSISVDKDATLTFTYIGYLTREILVNNRTAIDVRLSEDLTSIEEIVIVGYGTQKKGSVTAAVSSMKGAEIASTPITNLSNGLGGRLSGVIFRQGSGEPGQDASRIYIRGVSTTGNSQPLLVVDNIPRPFQNLDPNTIETITILKDAAAVAPYGVAGANGVILVTTKRGSIGKPSLTYNNFVGIQNPTVLPDYPNAFEYASLKNAASINEGLPPQFSAAVLELYKNGSDPDAYPDTDPWDIINRNTILTSHNIGISGGADKIKYYGSMGYLYEAGLFAATNQNRYNMSLNIDAEATKTTKVSLSINGRQQTNNSPYNTTERIFQTISNAQPLWNQIYSNGLIGGLLGGFIYNDGYRRTNTSQIFTQLSIDQKIPFIEGLSAKGTLAYDPTTSLYKRWATPIDIWAINTKTTPYTYTKGNLEQAKSALSQRTDNDVQLTSQFSLNYIRSFGKSNISALTLFETTASDFSNFGANRNNFNLDLDELNMGSSSQADISNFGSSSKARQVGFVYRIAYDYSSKYMIEASGRYDGSYYFAPGKRFGFFPSVALGWRVSEEKFMKDNISWLDNLKIRGSYGEVGALAGSPFQYLSSYGVNGPAYKLNGQVVQSVSERAESNPNITWERAKKTNVGLEAAFLNGLINLEVDYFYEKRANMLANPDVTVPVEYGVGLSQVNAGVMENKGIDLTIGTNYTISKDLAFSISGNFTYAKNALLQVFETPTTFNNPNRRLTGRPLSSQFGYESLGFFQLNDFDASGNLKPGIAIQPWGKVRAGDIRYSDINSDGKINTDDITNIGYSQTPEIVYGLAPTIRYKTFSLDLLFQGTENTSFYGSGSYSSAFAGGTNPIRENLNYWTPENTNAINPRITNAPTSNNTQVSSFWMYDSSYLRLKSTTLSFSIPSSALERMKIQNARIFVSGQNLLTWSKIKNYDPEIIHSQGYNYPQQKVVSLGINLTL
jgi:TonB-linked SusC/RagA family outer membrane protein